MRDSFFEEVGTDFKYKFGPDVSIICDIMKHPKAQGQDGISYEVKLSGAELIEFIKESAPTHVAIIEKIKPNGEYILTGWDW
jgi:hypothetical protein